MLGTVSRGLSWRDLGISPILCDAKAEPVSSADNCKEIEAYRRLPCMETWKQCLAINWLPVVIGNVMRQLNKIS